MMTKTDETPGEREAIEQLLPWYATGKLDASERARVERWLERDAALAFQLELIEEDRKAAAAASAAVAVPRTLTVERTMAQIGTERGWFARLREQARGFFTAPTPGAVRWAAAAAAVVIVAQAAVLGSLLAQRPGETYQTASGGPSAALDGTFALVRFADGAAIKDVAAALAALDMRIVDGPRQGNLFRVRLGAAGLDAAQRDAKAAALRQRSALVQLVLPAPPEEKRP